MIISEFKTILNRAIGLDGESIGDTALIRALRVRMNACGFEDNAYLRFLQANKDELSELIEEVIVPETWFFRDLRPFELLAKDALKSSAEHYRVLCAPCSSGEEPYSAAMALLSSGVAESKIHISGLDISLRAIEKAKKGIYRANSFRHKLPLYASRFFKSNGNEQHISEEIKRLVTFTAGNILKDGIPDIQFDVIFCRNFMIYLDTENRELLLEILESRLKPDGLLFVGHAEAMPLLYRKFAPVKVPGTFAFHKRVSSEDLQPEAFLENTHAAARPETSVFELPREQVEFKGRYTQVMAAATKLSSARLLKEKEVSRAVTRPVTKEDLPLERPYFGDVQRLADKGQVRQALELCNRLLDESKPDAEAFYLAGLLHETLGEITLASEYYRKSLYMNPYHTETLAHMVLMAEASGNSKQAQILRGRLERASAGRGE